MKKTLEKPTLEIPKADQKESREERLSRIRARVKAGFYTRVEVLRDVADALMYDPSAFENLP